MKISEGLRDEAAVLCAAMADWWDALYEWDELHPWRSPRFCWIETQACRISDMAWDAVVATAPQLKASLLYREAEALLRDGWCPGDPVYLRKVSP